MTPTNREANVFVMIKSRKIYVIGEGIRVHFQRHDCSFLKQTNKQVVSKLCPSAFDNAAECYPHLISKLKASDFTSGAEASDDFTRAWCECRTRDDVDSAANTSPPAPYYKVQYLVT